VSRRALKSNDEAGFMLASHDDLLETQQLYHVEVEIRLQPGIKRGTWEFHAAAYKRPRMAQDKPWAEGRYPYPTHAATSLYAALYRVCVRIGAECASAHRRHYGYNSSPDSVEPAE